MVTGQIEFAGADCAEEFTLATGADNTSAEPGTVMVIGAEESLQPECKRI